MTDDPTPTAATRSPSIRGRWAVYAAALYSVFGAFAQLSSLRRQLAGPRVDPVWFGVDAIRLAGLTLLIGLFVRYAFVIRWCNLATERGLARWEVAHAAVWRCVGVLLILNVTQLAYMATLPAVQLPVEHR